MKRIAVADPAMIKLTGHNRELNLFRAAEYVARGYQVDIYANKHYPVSEIDQNLDGVRILPHFSTSPYFFNQAEQEALGADGYLNAQATSFANELQLIGNDCPLLLPSAYPYLICGAVLAGWEHPVHGVIHRKPDFLMHRPSEHWRVAFRKSLSLKKPLGVHVLEPVLQRIYAKYAEGAVRIRLAPYPLQPVVKTSVKRQNNCIAILGGLRPEQGLEFVPAVVNSLVSSGFRVVIQDPANRLNGSSHPAIKIIGFVEDFRMPMQSCSAVLLNYDPAAYATSTSGVAWEALATGTPVLYSRGTASADTFHEYNCGLAFDYGSITQIHGAAMRLHGSYQKHLELAEAASKKVRLLHSVKRFVDHLAESGFAS
jgi:glycosyltransferase involved in cell wall biosynthesis